MKHNETDDHFLRSSHIVRSVLAINQFARKHRFGIPFPITPHKLFAGEFLVAAVCIIVVVPVT